MSTSARYANKLSLPTSAYIGLGANLGDAEATLARAIKLLAALQQTELVRASSLYWTAPLDASGPDFVNAVVELRTQLKPLQLLRELQQIEHIEGRQRSDRNAPRTLDLDLLLYGDVQLETPELTLPHPRFAQRAFVLLPLAEISPALCVANYGAVTDLLANVAQQRVHRID